MEVSTCKCMISVFLTVILCQVAVAVEQFDLLPCTEGDGGGMLYCIEYDSVGDVSYLHDNITRRITFKLPLLVVTQLWLNQGEIVIVTPSGEAINNGQELIRSQDRDRWTIVFNFERVNSDVGKLHLILHIKDVEYVDEQLLHVQIRTEDNIFATREKNWIPVHVNSNPDHEGGATTTDHPASDDPSAILLARIETLQNEKEVLQKEKMTAENTSIHYQNKYYHCLEAKDDLEGSTKPEFKGTGLTISSTLVFVIVELVIIVLIVAFVLVHVRNAGLILFNSTKSSFSIKRYHKSSLLPNVCEAFVDTNV